MPRDFVLPSGLSFRNRSGRVVALCRLLLAVTFFVALWIDPAQPVRSATLGYLILGFYLALSILLMGVAWISWWFDFRAARITHVLDIITFLVAIYFTEGSVDEFISPFLAFFAFLMLSSTIRWGWRNTIVTGLVATTLYLVVGLGLDALSFDFNEYRFGRRVTYMAVLGLILVWFGLQRQSPVYSRMPNLPERASRSETLLNALTYAKAEFDAGSGAMLWRDCEEPGLEVEAIGLEPDRKRLDAPDIALDASFGDSPRLFDCERNRGIMWVGGRPIRYEPSGKEVLAESVGIRSGLAIPCYSLLGKGEIFLAQAPGLSVDHIQLSGFIGNEIGNALDRQATMELSQAAIIARMRENVARDLHDTVAQSFAAMGMQLEGLRRYIASGGDPDLEIKSLKRSLLNEQRTVRRLISQLRGNNRDSLAGSDEHCQPFILLSGELEQAWNVDLDLEIDSRAAADRDFRHQVTNLIREAVANAVRHGSASQVTVRGIFESGELVLSVRDNGSGFPDEVIGVPPRSLMERVREIGGTLNLESSSLGTELTMVLPGPALS
ncbi:sensor histidine kinase [Qipengyuania sp. CAU 1752]